MAGRSMLPLLPHCGADAGRSRGVAHDEEGAGEKIRREKRDRTGEVRREPVLASKYFLQHNPCVSPSVSRRRFNSSDCIISAETRRHAYFLSMEILRRGEN